MDTASTEIYTLSLHDALPIFHQKCGTAHFRVWPGEQRKRGGSTRLWFVLNNKILRPRLGRGGQRPSSRSEERRVGKECRSRWWWGHSRKKVNNSVLDANPL